MKDPETSSTACLLLIPCHHLQAWQLLRCQLFSTHAKTALCMRLASLRSRLLGCHPLALYVVGRSHAYDKHLVLELRSSVQAPASFQSIVGVWEPGGGHARPYLTGLTGHLAFCVAGRFQAHHKDFDLGLW